MITADSAQSYRLDLLQTLLTHKLLFYVIVSLNMFYYSVGYCKYSLPQVPLFTVLCSSDVCEHHFCKKAFSDFIITWISVKVKVWKLAIVPLT